jgi:hypothetical protein
MTQVHYTATAKSDRLLELSEDNAGAVLKRSEGTLSRPRSATRGRQPRATVRTVGSG